MTTVERGFNLRRVSTYARPTPHEHRSFPRGSDWFSRLHPRAVVMMMMMMMMVMMSWRRLDASVSTGRVRGGGFVVIVVERVVEPVPETHDGRRRHSRVRQRPMRRRRRPLSSSSSVVVVVAAVVNF
jgi:hypothetical protein